MAESAVAVARRLDDLAGVGPRMLEDFHILGIHRVDQLRGRDPNTLYERLCALREVELDRCVLYVFRCAIYQAETDQPEPELTQWWVWKDGGLVERRFAAR